MKTPTWKIVTRMIPTDNSHQENSHQRKLPPRITPTRKIPTRKILTQDNSHLDNSHLENCHPGQFPPRKFLPRKIPTQLISIPDNCKPPNLTKLNNIQAISQNFLLANFFLSYMWWGIQRPTVKFSRSFYFTSVLYNW